MVDPLFWFSIVLLCVAALRWLNSGVAMEYDAQNGLWSLREPEVSFLPGSVEGFGSLHVMAVLGAMVLIQSGRHALGKSARVCFIFVGSVLAGLSAIVLCIALFSGHKATMAFSGCSVVDATYLGNAFGLYLAASPIALVGAFERKWKRAMPLLIVAMSGCGVGLYVFSPDFVIISYSVATLVVLAFSLLYAQKKISGLVVPKCSAFIFISACAGYLLVTGLVPEEVKSARFAWLFEDGGKIFSDSFLSARDVLSGIASAVWKDRPWNGSGLGSFGVDIRFLAKSEDWRLLAPGQAGALNGWWQIVAERGITGTILFVSPLFFLAWTYVIRALAAFGNVIAKRRLSSIATFHPLCWLGPVVVAVTVACGFIDHSFWRAEVIMAVAAMFAMAGSAFPVVAKQADAESETEK